MFEDAVKRMGQSAIAEQSQELFGDAKHTEQFIYDTASSVLSNNVPNRDGKTPQGSQAPAAQAATQTTNAASADPTKDKIKSSLAQATMQSPKLDMLPGLAANFASGNGNVMGFIAGKIGGENIGRAMFRLARCGKSAGFGGDMWKAVGGDALVQSGKAIGGMALDAGKAVKDYASDQAVNVGYLTGVIDDKQLKGIQEMGGGIGGALRGMDVMGKKDEIKTRLATKLTPATPAMRQAGDQVATVINDGVQGAVNQNMSGVGRALYNLGNMNFKGFFDTMMGDDQFATGAQ